MIKKKKNVINSDVFQMSYGVVSMKQNCFFLIQPCETSKVLVILTGVNIILDEQGHVTYYTVPFNLTEIKA